MFEGIPVSFVNGIGVVGAVLIIGYLIASDRLVPRRAVDKLLAVMDARLAEMADRNADLVRRNEDLLEANTLSGKQAEALTRVAETQTLILQSIEKLARRRQS